MVTLQSLVKLLAYLEARKNACTKEEGGIYSLGGRGKVEIQVSLGFPCCLQRMHCVDFAENALLKISGDIC